MLILCSPTKTMRKTNEKGICNPKFIDTSNKLLNILKTYDKKKIKECLKINDKLADVCLKMYENYQEDNLAIEAFNGLQFKYLNWNELNKEEKEYAYEHINILSGLYGLVRPYDKIGIYRLDYDNIINDIKVIEYHRKNVNNYLKKQKGPIIDLCSKEYANILNVAHIRIEFLEENLKVKATNSKMQRGKMMRYCITSRIDDINLLKEYHEDGYYYNDKLSDDSNYIFVKKGE